MEGDLFGDVFQLRRESGGLVLSLVLPWPAAPEKLADGASEEERQKYAEAVKQVEDYLKRMEALHLGIIQFTQP